MFNINQYFEGEVASIGHEGKDGKATVGVIAPGEYNFDTSTVEIMTVISGEMNVKLPGATEWKTYQKFQSFRVEKGKNFEVSVDEDTPYHCLYL